jgi:cobalt-zinc-cadmium resistance protein CzcA
MNALITFAQAACVDVCRVRRGRCGLHEAQPRGLPPLVDIVTQSTGHSAEEIERTITIPIEIQMARIPNISAIRTISLVGLSDVKVRFTYQPAEQWMVDRLSRLPAMPNGAHPSTIS